MKFFNIIKLKTGYEGEGKVLTSDAYGTSTWETPEGGTVSSGIVKIGELLAADMNTTDDQAIEFIEGAAFLVVDIVIANASIELNTVDGGGFFTEIERGGIAIADVTSNPDGFGLLTTSMKFINIGPSGNNEINLNQYNDLVTELYFSVTTPQGAPATADIRVYGYKIA